MSIDSRELALILEGIELPSRKKRMKAAREEGRAKALRTIAAFDTDTGV